MRTRTESAYTVLFSGELKSRIVDALLDSTTNRAWGKKFEKFGLIKYADNSDEAYTDLEFSETLDSDGLHSVYY